MTFAAVSCDAIWLLKALATDLAGEAQGGRCLCMLAPVPVQGGLLAAGEPADLTPVPGVSRGELRASAQLPECPAGPLLQHPTLTAAVSLQCGCAGG